MFFSNLLNSFLNLFVLFHLSFRVYLYIGYHPFWLYSTINFARIKMESCINVQIQTYSKGRNQQKCTKNRWQIANRCDMMIVLGRIAPLPFLEENSGEPHSILCYRVIYSKKKKGWYFYGSCNFGRRSVFGGF